MDIKKTVTSIFMIPTLKIPKNQLRNNGFINGYFKDKSKDVQYEDVIYILFKPEDLDKFREFLDVEYERTKDVIEDYDYEDGFVVVIYKLNPKFKKDYEIVKTGKYSKTSQAFQKLFPKTVKITTGTRTKEEISLQYRIFNRTEDLVQFWEDKLGVYLQEYHEVWHGFDEEEEILDIEKIKKLMKAKV